MLGILFLGDIAYPFKDLQLDVNNNDIFSDLVIANFEGGIDLDNQQNFKQHAIFNDPKVIEYLKSLNVKVVTLANNHVFDIHAPVDNTIKVLLNNGIIACGAGKTLKEAKKPAIVEYKDSKVFFLGFGWELIGCCKATNKKAGVNPLIPTNVLSSVAELRKTNRDAIIVLLMHWNYELELYPQPMDRQLARKAIDLGANAVIGCHSHCVQGIEVYKGAPIVYGLGNWCFPQGVYWGGKLKFPQFTKLQLAFEWEPVKGNMTCHWFKYDETDHSINWIESMPLEKSERIIELTPFAGFSHKDYIKWFKKNRRKKKLLPVYKDINSLLPNKIKDNWIKTRHLLIKTLFELNFKKGPE